MEVSWPLLVPVLLLHSPWEKHFFLPSTHCFSVWSLAFAPATVPLWEKPDPNTIQPYLNITSGPAEGPPWDACTSSENRGTPDNNLTAKDKQKIYMHLIHFLYRKFLPEESYDSKSWLSWMLFSDAFVTVSAFSPPLLGNILSSSKV